MSQTDKPKSLSPDLAYRHAIDLYEQQQFTEAYELFKNLPQFYPFRHELFYYLADIEYKASELQLSLQHIQKAISCPHGDIVKYMVLKGKLYQRLGDETNAFNSFTHGIYIDSKDMSTYEGISKLRDVNVGDRTVRNLFTLYIKRYIDKCPDDPIPYYSLSSILIRYDYESAIKYLLNGMQKQFPDEFPKTLTYDDPNFKEQFITFCIDHDMIPVMILFLLRTQYLYESKEDIISSRKELEDSIELLNKKIDYGTVESISTLAAGLNISLSFPLSYHNFINRELFQKINKLLAMVCPTLEYISPNVKLSQGGQIRLRDKIRVGFFSGFLAKNHSVCRDRKGVILGLNPEIFDVRYITTGDISSNQIFAKDLYRRAKSKPHKLNTSDFKKAQEFLASLDLDIFVFCEIGMAQDAYFLAHGRYAPTQINTWGHSDTSGIRSIDYYVSSKHFEVPDLEEAQTHYSEKLIAMNSLSTYYYNPLGMIKDQGCKFKTRHELGFSDDSHIYSGIQTLIKMHPDFDEVIVKIIIMIQKRLFFY